jgi:hypothetical protein
MLKKIFLFGILVLVLGLSSSALAQGLYDPLHGQTLGGFANTILKGLMTLAVPLMAIMTIWGAINLAMAAGNPSKIKEAQQAITWAIGGLAIVMLVEGLFKFGMKEVSGASSLTQLLNTVQRYLLLIGGPLCIVMFLYGSFLLGTASPENIKKAKNVFIWTSVALAVISVATVANIISLINNLAK